MNRSLVLAVALLAVLMLLPFVSPVRTQEAAKPDYKGAVVNKTGAVSEKHLVLVRSTPQGRRIETYDPETDKTVAIIATFPQDVGVDHVALSPDRKRVAFASTLNNLVTLLVWNVFVIELETGALNQLTPDGATNRGLLQPKTGTGTATVTGKLAWIDPERGRSNHFLFGNVRLDGVECLGILKGDGSFVIEGVPCSEPFSSYLLSARANIPATQAQEGGAAQGSLAITVKPGETKDIGEITVHPPVIELALGFPSWGKNGVYVNALFSAYVQFVSYPERKVGNWDKSLLDYVALESCGFLASPDGKHIAGADRWSNADPNDYKEARCITFFDAATGKQTRRVDLGGPNDLYISSANHGTWLPDSSAYVVPGTYNDFKSEPNQLMVPCLFAASPDKAEARLLKSWPEAAGKGNITSLTVDKGGTKAYLVLSQLTEQGAKVNTLWVWDSKADTTTQIGKAGDIISIDLCGR